MSIQFTLYEKLVTLRRLMFAAAFAWRYNNISGFYDHQLDSSYFAKCRNDIDKALKLDPVWQRLRSH